MRTLGPCGVSSEASLRSRPASSRWPASVESISSIGSVFAISGTFPVGGADEPDQRARARLPRELGRVGARLAVAVDALGQRLGRRVAGGAQLEVGGDRALRARDLVGQLLAEVGRAQDLELAVV